MKKFIIVEVGQGDAYYPDSDKLEGILVAGSLPYYFDPETGEGSGNFIYRGKSVIDIDDFELRTGGQLFFREVKLKPV